MVSMYCARHHCRKDDLCPECADLVAYSEDRMDNCVFKRSKPTCLKCPVHCYSPHMRARMRTVMRYAGPRMLSRHPILTVEHMLDGLRRPQR